MFKKGHVHNGYGEMMEMRNVLLNQFARNAPIMRGNAPSMLREPLCFCDGGSGGKKAIMAKIKEKLPIAEKPLGGAKAVPKEKKTEVPGMVYMQPTDIRRVNGIGI